MITIEDRSGSRVITFARAEKHNALGVADYQLIGDSLRELNDRNDISSVQIVSEGRTFCAGNNLAEFKTEWPQPAKGPVFQFFSALAATRVPIIAGVQGGAIGVGATMLLHCDVILMTDEAWLSYPFVPRGIAPEGGASEMLPARLGYTRAMEILLSGRKIAAAEAVSLGLGSKLVAADSLATEVLAWSEQINELPREAVIETKQLLKANYASVVPELFENELQVINKLITLQNVSS